MVEHDVCTAIKQSKVPKGTKILDSTWAMKMKMASCMEGSMLGDIAKYWVSIFMHLQLWHW